MFQPLNYSFVTREQRCGFKMLHRSEDLVNPSFIILYVASDGLTEYTDVCY